jgi:hypothetical protein
VRFQRRRKSVKALLVCALAVALCGGTAYGKEEPVAYFIQTIVGTNLEKAEESQKWKQVGPRLARDLSPVFKWKHYWQVSCQKIDVREGKLSRIQLTRERELEVQIGGDRQLQLRLFRDGKLVRKMKDLVSHRRVIMGGDSSKDEAWFVVIRRDKPSTE